MTPTSTMRHTCMDEYYFVCECQRAYEFLTAELFDSSVFFAFAKRADLLLVSSSSLLYRRYYDHRETRTVEFAMGVLVLLVSNFGRFAWSTLLGLWDAWQRLQHYITSTGWDWAADYEHWDIGVFVVFKRRVRGHHHKIRWPCLFRNEMVLYSHLAFHEWFLLLLHRVDVTFLNL